MWPFAPAQEHRGCVLMETNVEEKWPDLHEAGSVRVVKHG